MKSRKIGFFSTICNALLQKKYGIGNWPGTYRGYKKLCDNF